MKKTLSPIYITIPFVSPATGLTSTQYRLEIRVWDGSKSSPPVLASYSKTVKNLSSSTGSQTVNISRLVNDFLDVIPSPTISAGTSLLTGDNQRWTKTEVFYTTSNVSEASTSQSVSLYPIVKGYTYGNEGANVETPTNKNLISYTEFNVSRTGAFILPIEIPETTPTPPSLTLSSVVLVSGTTYTLTFVPVGSYSTLDGYAEGTGGRRVETLTGVTSTKTMTIPWTGSVDVEIRGFDNDTATSIVSNIINITI